MPTKESYRTVLAGKLILLAVLMLPVGGCQQIAALIANIHGGDVIEPQYTLTKLPLLIFIDDKNGRITEPVAIRELYATIVENFLHFDVNDRVIPFRRWQHLQQSERAYEKMSIREIGEKLGADQVLYIKVDQFALTEPGTPLYRGAFAVRVKVITTERTEDVRVWPTNQSGYRVEVSTEPVSMEGEKAASDIARELATKLGQQVAGLFYEHREFAE